MELIEKQRKELRERQRNQEKKGKRARRNTANCIYVSKRDEKNMQDGFTRLYRLQTGNIQ